jgi:hypothetical protein
MRAHFGEDVVPFAYVHTKVGRYCLKAYLIPYYPALPYIPTIENASTSSLRSQGSSIEFSHLLAQRELLSVS